MKIKNYLLAVCLMAGSSVFAQDVDKSLVTGNADAALNAAGSLKSADTGESNWKFDGVVGANAAATGLVNWAAGGKNNVNGVAYAKLHLLYHKDQIAWESNFDTDFGMTWINQEEDPFQKSSDQIKFTTKFGWEFSKNFYLTALGSFQSQYALGHDYVTGYNPVISKWLAPSYTDISVGIDWKKSVNGADFSVYVSPIAGRITTAYVGDKVNNNYTNALQQAWLDGDEAAGDAYKAATMLQADGYQHDLRYTLQNNYGTYKFDNNGDKQFKNARAEFGLSVKGGVAYKYEALTLGTTISLFTPYAWDKTPITDEYFQYKDMNRRFGNFDVDWDVAISYQFLKVLNVTLSTSLKYYNGTLVANSKGELAERVQFKSVLGLGIGYSF